MKSRKKIGIFGHRGNFYQNIENTIESINSAWKHVDGVELDVQLTKDDIPILFHDMRLGESGFSLPNKKNEFLDNVLFHELENCIFNKDQLEKKLSKKACKSINLEIGSIPQIHKLDDLNHIPTNKKILLELKCNDKKEPYKKTLSTLVLNWLEKNDFIDNVILISFDKEIIEQINSLNPKVRIGLNITQTPEKNIESEVLLESGSKVTFLLPPFSEVNEALLKKCNEENLEIIPWASGEALKEELEEIFRIVSLGITSFVTNQPNAASVFLKEKGLA